MNKQLVTDLFDEILEKYYWSEVSAMQEFETSENEGWEEGFKQDIKEYKRKLNDLLNQTVR